MRRLELAAITIAIAAVSLVVANCTNQNAKLRSVCIEAGNPPLECARAHAG